jgi:oxygen-dependent protoporphyrinogen oxidase
MNAAAGRRRVVVVGGGISGLSAAYTLARARGAGAPVEEFLVEAAPRPGGVIQSEQVEGCVVEAGPDGFLTEKPEAAALAHELGLGDLLVASNDAERRTYILSRGRLMPLPDGLMLMVPTRLGPLLSSPLVPMGAKLALVAEWFQRPPRANAHRDESVADFVRRHFGQAMLENIADPLLAGVYGGDSNRLSARSALPRFWQMEQKYGSLARGARRIMSERRRRAREALPPLFMTLKGGISKLIDGLVAQLEPKRVHLARRVERIEGMPSGGSARYRVSLAGGPELEAEGVIVALPAPDAGRVLSELSPALAMRLAEIPYSPAMTVSLGFEARDAASLPPGFGFLVPWKEKRRLLACTFVHRKFPGGAPEGKALVRCFLGGSRDAGILELSEEEVLALVRRELAEILNLCVEPRFARIHRWPSAMAQYVVGHEDRLHGIQSELEKHPGIFLAGNAYTGIGISDCIRTGREAAERAIQSVAG